ncbi:MAG: YicC family protein [Ignavibacteriales bacterium]|nr:YicC family protein [Ignavibacteriales bacterium]
MLKSMTGIGTDAFSNENFTLETEIKSLNSRFLDLSIKLPKELYKHEFAIRDLIKNKIGRGKVTLSIVLTYNKLTNGNSPINSNALKNAVDILTQINNYTNSDSKIELNQILMLRDMFLSENQESNGIDFEIITNSVSSAVEKFNQMKKSEGLELKKDLVFRINKILEELTKIENITKNSTVEFFEKFKERAKKLADEYIDDKERFTLEMAILSEKHDITEESIRLRSHIKLFCETLDNDEDSGRKLNFITQEMNREINTINSKSISSEIAHAGIIIKEELEKIREQIQNIE